MPKSTSDRHTPVLDDAGEPTGATFAIDLHKPSRELSLRFDSRGTSEGTVAYRAGLVLLLARLKLNGYVLMDAAIETRTTADLSRAKRRCRIPVRYPVRLREADPEQLRAWIATASAKAGRPPGAKGGGNTTKRLRLYLHDGATSQRPRTWEQEARRAKRLETLLAEGTR